MPNRDTFVASLAGGWAGVENMTPLGLMPFAVLLEWEEDGSLHSRSALNRETYVDLRFERSESGEWVLHEEAAMEGIGAQSHSLRPVKGPAGLYRWSFEERPGFLVVDLSMQGDIMVMTVTLRGEDHARFSLQRLPEEALPELREQLVVQAHQSPSEGPTSGDVLGRSDRSDRPGRALASGDPDAIARARDKVTTEPANGVAHLELARVLGHAIQEDGAVNGPLYSFEMLRSLETAIELDPALQEAYQWLVGYYMNAPAIAGGSIDKAIETARRLEDRSPASSKALLAQIEAGRKSPE
jgi:hypothetical protein